MEITFYQDKRGTTLVRRGKRIIGSIQENPDGTYRVRVGRSLDSAVPYSLTSIQEDILRAEGGRR